MPESPAPSTASDDSEPPRKVPVAVPRRSFRSTLFQCTVIVGAGAAIGFLLNGLHARALTMSVPIYAVAETGTGACSSPVATTRISPAAAAGLCSDCNVSFVDARPASAFAQGHVAGAVHLPPAGHQDERRRMSELAQKKTVVVYDDLSACNLAESVGQRLRQSGVADVRVLEGGWSGWQARGQPAASGACEICAEHSH